MFIVFVFQLLVRFSISIFAKIQKSHFERGFTRHYCTQSGTYRCVLTPKCTQLIEKMRQRSRGGGARGVREDRVK
jgi:hypothetical protein